MSIVNHFVQELAKTIFCLVVLFLNEYVFVFQGYGKSQVAVWLGSLIINLVLNYVLVIRLDMGPE